MEWKTYVADDAKMQQIATYVYETVVGDLQRVGVLTEAQKTECLNNYTVVFVRKGWFGRLFDRVIHMDDKTPAGQESWICRLVKYN